MKLYYHCDRANRLRPGSAVESEPYFNESLLGIFTPFMDAEFADHLNKLCREGLSLHGAHYLIQISVKAVPYADFITEIYYEYIRWKHYPRQPSRLQSLFAWKEYADALNFARGNGSKGHIYEVDCGDRSFAGDMNLLKLDFDPQKQERYARMYWEGKPLETGVDYRPLWECVINLPVTIRNEVLVNPLTMEI